MTGGRDVGPARRGVRAAAAERCAVLLAAYAVDRAVGDPPRPTHPARLMGRAIAGYEKVARRAVSGPAQEQLAGLVLAVGLPALVTVGTRRLLTALPAPLRLGAEVWLLSTALASRDLGMAALRVEAGLGRSLEEGRREVSMIVGRDTAEMGPVDVVRATVETVAENTGDAVVAPVMYAAIGGAPLALGFKAVSTLDSMVGYKNERYLHLGRASARLDDAANLVPARLTAVLALLAGRSGLQGLRRSLADRRHHESPNAGLVEASFAQALRLRLGGPARYGGVMVERPSVGAEFGPPAESDVARTVRLSDRVGWMAVAVATAAVWSAGLAGIRPLFAGVRRRPAGGGGV